MFTVLLANVREYLLTKKNKRKKLQIEKSLNARNYTKMSLKKMFSINSDETKPTKYSQREEKCLQILLYNPSYIELIALRNLNSI